MRLFSITLIYAVKLFMTTTFKDLIPDGTKFHYPKVASDDYSGELAQDAHAWVRSTQNRTGIRKRHWTTEFTTEPPAIEDCEEMHGS